MHKGIFPRLLLYNLRAFFLLFRARVQVSDHQNLLNLGLHVGEVWGIDFWAACRRDSSNLSSGKNLSIYLPVSSGLGNGGEGRVRDFWNLNQSAFLILNLGIFWVRGIWRDGKSIIIGKWSPCKLLW